LFVTLNGGGFVLTHIVHAALLSSIVRSGPAV
jgi:hypothetical protein